MIWVYVLLGAVMFGAMGQTLDGKNNLSTAIPLTEGTIRRQTEVTNAKNRTNKPLVHQTKSLPDAERDFILDRKKVVQKALINLGVKSPQSSVPHIALLASGGGQRAALSVLGALRQLEKEGLLDAMLYLGGISGSTWSMALLYSDLQWSRNLDTAISRLSGPLVNPLDALSWLGDRVKEEHFSLSDIWGLMTSGLLMRQLDTTLLSKVELSPNNPYPIYNAIERNCFRDRSLKGIWFELTPHQSGFTDLGLFVNTSMLGSRVHDVSGGQRTDLDQVSLQGIMGNNIADENVLLELFPDWLRGLVGAIATDENNLLDVILLWTGVPQTVNNVWQVFDRYIRGYHSLIKITEIIKRYSNDPAVGADLEKLQRTLRASMNLNPAVYLRVSRRQREEILELWGQQIFGPLLKLSQTLEDGPIKTFVTVLVGKILPLIWNWEWGTTENFLYKHPDPMVPSCITLSDHLNLMDAGVEINLPFPPFLGEMRDMDLLISLDYSGDAAFTALLLGRDYAAQLKKPFPKIDDQLVQKERDFPRSCYVFDGKGTAPTIVYLPLFNRDNSKDGADIRAKLEDFTAFQLPLNQERMAFLMETAAQNIKNCKDTLLKELNKAALRRRMKRASTVRPLNLTQFVKPKP